MSNELSRETRELLARARRARAPAAADHARVQGALATKLGLANGAGAKSAAGAKGAKSAAGAVAKWVATVVVAAGAGAGGMRYVDGARAARANAASSERARAGSTERASGTVRTSPMRAAAIAQRDAAMEPVANSAPTVTAVHTAALAATPAVGEARREQSEAPAGMGASAQVAREPRGGGTSERVRDAGARASELGAGELAASEIAAAPSELGAVGAGVGAGGGGYVASTGAAEAWAEEVQHVRGARRALRAGQAAAALGLLEEHAARFPNGVLREERMATRVSALCALGRVHEASEAGARFAAEFPRSPYAARARAGCPVANGANASRTSSAPDTQPAEE